MGNKIKISCKSNGYKVWSFSREDICSWRKTGDGAINTVFEYNQATDSWNEKKSLSNGRWGHTVAEKNGQLYTIGGYNKKIVNTIEIYDPETDGWVVNKGLKDQRFNLDSSLVDGKIYATGGQNYFLGGTLATNEVLSESGIDNNEVVSSIDIITLTSGDDTSNSTSPVYFQAYKEDGKAIYNDVNGMKLDIAEGFTKNASNRFTLTGNELCTINDLKSFKLTITGTDGWKIKGLMVIVISKRVLYSNLEVNTWIDTDSLASKPSIERNFDKFINPELNRSKILSSSNISVITTTTTNTNAQTGDSVYMRMGANTDGFLLKEYFNGKLYKWGNR